MQILQLFSAEIEQKRLIFQGLVNFASAGSELVTLVTPTAPLSFYPFNLPYSETRSNGAVRIPDAFLVLEKCFYVSILLIKNIFLGCCNNLLYLEW